MRIIKTEKSSIILIIVGLALIVLGIIFFLWQDFNLDPTKPIKSDKFGQLGDFVGGIVGSIWALAGVLLFYVALIDQREDFKTNQKILNLQVTASNLQVEALNQQIKEFQQQSKEIELNRKIYEQQSKTLLLQQFESNFYSLLNVYLTIKDNLNNIDSNKDYFKTLCHLNNIEFDPSKNTWDHYNQVVDWYVNLFLTNRGHLSHYFKSFYRILKIIDSNPNLTRNEKIFYAKILRSQLTDYENLILAYNSYSNYGAKARPLILEYNILKHIPLFSKVEFEYFDKIQKGNGLLIFAEWLKWFLVEHIPKFYNWEPEPIDVEVPFNNFGCTVGIYFSDKIEIKIKCKLDISENGITLSDKEFANFLEFFMYEHLVYGSYLNPENVTIIPSTNLFPENKIFSFSIQSENRLLQNQDTR